MAAPWPWLGHAGLGYNLTSASTRSREVATAVVVGAARGALQALGDASPALVAGDTWGTAGLAFLALPIFRIVLRKGGAFVR